ERLLKLAGVPARAKALGALAARNHADVDVRIGDTLADPLVVDWTVAGHGDTLLMDLVVVERAIVGHHEQDRNAVMHSSPHRRAAHHEVAVAADRDRHAAGALEGERRTDRNARSAADAATAVGAHVIARLTDR